MEMAEHEVNLYAVGAITSRRSNKIQTKEKENKSEVRERSLRVGGVKREKLGKYYENERCVTSKSSVRYGAFGGLILIPAPLPSPTQGGKFFVRYIPLPAPRPKSKIGGEKRGPRE